MARPFVALRTVASAVAALIAASACSPVTAAVEVPGARRASPAGFGGPAGPPADDSAGESAGHAGAAAERRLGWSVWEEMYKSAQKTNLCTILGMHRNNLAGPDVKEFMNHFDSKGQRQSVANAMCSSSVTGEVVPAMLYALELGHIDSAQTILECGANPDKALEAASWHKKNYPLIKWLLEHGANIDNAILMNVGNHRTEAVEVLLAHGADLYGVLLQRAAMYDGQPKWVGGLADDLIQWVDVNRALVKAAEQNLTSAAHFLIGRGADLQTSLIMAAEEGEKSAARRLIKQGAKIDDALWGVAKNTSTNTSVQMIAAQVLLDLGADSNGILVRAAEANSASAAKVLIARGANVNEALGVAARRGHTSAMEFLVEHGGDLDSALWKSAEHEHNCASRVLIEQGADIYNVSVGAADAGRISVTNFLLSLNCSGCSGGGCGGGRGDRGANVTEALAQAAETNKVSAAHYFMKLGADVNDALWKVADKNQTAAIPLLVEWGADLEKVLVRAVVANKITAAKVLLSHGADKNRALASVAVLGHVSAAKFLTGQGADTNSALVEVARRGQGAAADLLVRGGADSGDALLEAACSFDAKAVHFLRDDLGADVGSVAQTRDLQCAQIPASPSDWLAVTSVALVAGSLLAWLVPRLSTMTCSDADSEGALLLADAESKVESGSSDNEGMDGAKVLVLQAWLSKQEGCLQQQVWLYSLGRLNSQLLFIVFLAWLCERGNLMLSMGVHDVSISSVLLMALVVGLIMMALPRPPSATRTITAMDFILPRSVSLSGLEPSDGRLVVVIELARLAIGLCLAMPGSPLWAWAWPPRLPGTMAGTQLEMISLVGLQDCFLVVCGIVAVSAAMAVLHSIASLSLLCGSSAAAVNLRCGSQLVKPEEVDECARALISLRSHQLADDDGSSSSSSSSDVDEIRLTLGDKDFEVRVLTQAWGGYGKVKFLALSVAPLAADIVLDISSARNFMIGGHVLFGTMSLTLFVYSVVKNWKRWRAFKQDVLETMEYGYQTQGFYELTRGEVEDEAVLSLALNLYGLPWAINGWPSLALQCTCILLSVNGLVQRMVQRDLGL